MNASTPSNSPVAGEPAQSTPEERARHQALMLQISEALVQAPPDREAIARIIFDRVTGPLDVDVCFNYVVEKGELHLVAGYGIPAGFWADSQVLKVGVAFCGTVAATKQPLRANLERVETDPRGAFVKAMSVRSYMCHPLFSRSGDLIGTFSLASTRRTNFTPGETEFLQTLAHFMALSWERNDAEFQRKKLEEQLLQSQKMEALGTLSGGIAHDFNNILFAILGNAELARQASQGGGSPLEFIDEIGTAGRRARDLVRRILTFSRPQAPERTAVSLPKLADEVIHLLRPTIPANIRIHLEAVGGVPPVHGDASQIHQVLVNLATNSWQAMEGQPGRIDIAVQGCRVDSTLTVLNPELHKGPYALLTVRDTGKGMDQQTLARIFEPFFTTKAPGVGTGLGLSVVHGIMRSHGGTVMVDSQPGRGTTFYLYFPVELQEAPKTEQAPTEAGVQPGHGEHILYLDDEEVLVRLCRRKFESLGYRATGFTHADEALAAMQALPEGFDLVITDYNMPGLSGLKVAAAVRQLNAQVPIVLVSGFITQELEEQARQAGVCRVVYKPDTFGDLLKIMPGLLARKTVKT